ncbi:hypothetical protein SNEBB_005819 [Seison nebaliae]|nr:hypothetical protein SNEBB_005819 [Seison nebaliae]
MKIVSCRIEWMSSSQMASPSCVSNFFKDDNSFIRRAKLVFHNLYFIYFIMALVLLDCIFVIGELVLETELKEGNIPVDSPLKNLPHILHYISLGILSFFMLEILVKLYVERWHFFRSRLEIFDAIVVIVSFALDIVFLTNDGLPQIAIMIVLRIWRFARIVNGIVLTTKIKLKIKSDKLKNRIHMLEGILIENQIEFNMKT